MKRLRTAAAGGDDAGVGLVELVVSMAVGSVLLLALGTTFTGTVRSSASATASVTSAAELRPALDTMGRRLRVAVRPPPTEPALPAPTATSLSFYASLLPPGGTAALPPTLVAWSLGCPNPTSPVPVPGIAETRTTPSGSASAGWSWATPASVRTTCLAQGVVNADGAPLFRYYTQRRGWSRRAPHARGPDGCRAQRRGRPRAAGPAGRPEGPRHDAGDPVQPPAGDMTRRRYAGVPVHAAHEGRRERVSPAHGARHGGRPDPAPAHDARLRPPQPAAHRQRPGRQVGARRRAGGDRRLPRSAERRQQLLADRRPGQPGVRQHGRRDPGHRRRSGLVPLLRAGLRGAGRRVRQDAPQGDREAGPGPSAPSWPPWCLPASSSTSTTPTSR